MYMRERITFKIFQDGVAGLYARGAVPAGACAHQWRGKGQNKCYRIMYTMDNEDKRVWKHRRNGEKKKKRENKKDWKEYESKNNNVRKSNVTEINFLYSLQELQKKIEVVDGMKKTLVEINIENKK